MNKNFRIILEKRDQTFFCSIPELKIFSESQNLPDAYEKIEALKNERLKNNAHYEQFSSNGSYSKKNFEDYLKISITVLFFLLLAVGIGSHLVSTFLGSLSHRVDKITEKVSTKLDISRSLNSLSALTPEEKAAKVKRFEAKVAKAQQLLIEAKPFIEASKPFLKDLQDSFDLKRPKQ